MIVNNHDIAGLHARINRFIDELYKSVSSGSSQTNAFDQARLNTYLNAVDVYRSWVTAQPQLDLPETHPRAIELEPDPAVASVENENVNDLIRMLQLARDETVNSQSARAGAGLNQFDDSRLTSVIAKARAFLVDYIAVVTPLDLPESSPQEPMSGPGKKGI